LKASDCGLDLTLDNIEEVQGEVAADANHTREKKLQQRLDRSSTGSKNLDRYDTRN
jgi:hypothetical protein